jgi:flagellar biosynthesis anti-sigma factor FlgM
MRSYRDTAHSAVDPSWLQVGTIPARETKIGRSQGRAIQADQMRTSPRLREIRQAGQILAQTFEVRETKIVALRRDIESGHYSVKAEQVAEKIVQDHLLELFDYY